MPSETAGVFLLLGTRPVQAWDRPVLRRLDDWEGDRDGVLGREVVELQVPAVPPVRPLPTGDGAADLPFVRPERDAHEDLTRGFVPQNHLALVRTGDMGNTRAGT